MDNESKEFLSADSWKSHHDKITWTNDPLSSGDLDAIYDEEMQNLYDYCTLTIRELDRRILDSEMRRRPFYDRAVQYITWVHAQLMYGVPTGQNPAAYLLTMKGALVQAKSILETEEEHI